MAAPKASFLRKHISHHGRFYAAVFMGVLVFLSCADEEFLLRIAAAGNAFFLVYLVETGFVMARLDGRKLKKRAAVEDEGAFLVVLIALAVIAMILGGIFAVLNQAERPNLPILLLSLAGAPLAWFTLHTLMAFHYANLHYFADGDGKTGPALEFPFTREPGPWDFLYFSFVIGMTCQTSDVQIRASAMRRAALGHSVVSFFFNTVLIAMAVNGVVAKASS